MTKRAKNTLKAIWGFTEIVFFVYVVIHFSGHMSCSTPEDGWTTLCGVDGCECTKGDCPETDDWPRVQQNDLIMSPVWQKISYPVVIPHAVKGTMSLFIRLEKCQATHTYGHMLMKDDKVDTTNYLIQEKPLDMSIFPDLPAKAPRSESKIYDAVHKVQK